MKADKEKSRSWEPRPERDISIWRLTIVSCLLLSLSYGQFESHGEEVKERAPRPKIGIALAGGSALGLAHVGVLKWLEEHHVPIDVVVGTSMGGLVGGLYASGYDYQEMAEFIGQIDWSEALQLSTPFRSLTFRRKEDRVDFPNQLELGLRNGFSFPSGLSAGNGVGLLISRFTSPYANLKSFDDLPTPFRCIAVDLKEGKEVIFQDGALFDALRSTMALPGVFSPWKVGDRVLVDGGVLNNLPVDIAKKMGADVVIAVALRGLSIEGKPPSSLLGIANRSIDITVIGNQQRNMGLADILLMPELEGFKSADFNRAKELEQAGYEAAARKARFLEILSIDAAIWTEHVQARQRRRLRPTQSPDFIKVTGVRPDQEERIEKRFSALTKENYNRVVLETELTKLTGLGRYAAADYREAEVDRREGIEVMVREKDYGPPFLNTALLIDGSQSEGFRFGLGGRLTFLDVGGPFSEWRTDFNIGTINRIGTEYYWRVRGGPFFIAPRAYFDDSVFSYYENGKKLFTYNLREPGVGADLGIGGGRFSELRFGYQLGTQKVYHAEGLPTLPDIKGNRSLLRLRWTYNNQDSAIIPREGIKAITEAQWVMASPVADKSYPLFETKIDWAHPLGRRYIFSSRVAGGITGSGQVPLPLFSLGGSFHLSALAQNQLLGSRYYYGDLMLFRSFSDQSLSLFGKLYLFGAYEIGNAFNRHASANPFQDGAFGIAGETFIGVFFFGGSFGEGGERKIFFRLGRLFW